MSKKTLGQIGALCVCFLTLCLLPMAASGAFSAEGQPESDMATPLHEESNEWELRVDDEGNNYLYNTANGTSIISCCAYSGNELVRVDIDEALLEDFNAPADTRVFHGAPEELDGSEPAGTPIASYIYREAHAGQMYGAESRLTPTVIAEYGDAVLGFTSTLTFTESLGEAAGHEDAIRAGVSFEWTRSASINGGDRAALILPQGKVGYLAFRPLLNVSSGMLTTAITDGYYTDALDKSVTVSCPAGTGDGFAGGYLYIAATGDC